MELKSYLEKKIKLELINNFLYEGVVLDTDEDSLTILDKFKNKVSVSKKSILSIREVSDGEGARG